MAESKSRSRIAVVDDDVGVRETFIRILESDSCDVSGFESGDVFLKHRPSHPFQCIILDLEMPGTDGIGVLEKLRSLPNSPPIVVVTGSADSSLHAAAASRPRVAILKKPVSVDELLDAVNNTLS